MSGDAGELSCRGCTADAGRTHSGQRTVDLDCRTGVSTPRPLLLNGAIEKRRTALAAQSLNGGEDKCDMLSINGNPVSGIEPDVDNRRRTTFVDLAGTANRALMERCMKLTFAIGTLGAALAVASSTNLSAQDGASNSSPYTLIPNGNTVYDKVNGVTWLADA